MGIELLQAAQQAVVQATAKATVSSVLDRPHCGIVEHHSGMTHQLMQLFKGFEDFDTFFSTSERSLLVWHILLRTKYKRNRKSIGRLLANKAYSAAYPLHDSNCDPDSADLCGTRSHLYQHWGQFTKFYKSQPMEEIKEYFGEKIGVYACSLSLYCSFSYLSSVISPCISFILLVSRVLHS